MTSKRPTRISPNQFAGRDLLVEVEVTANWYTNTEAGMAERYPFVDHQSCVGVIFLGRDGHMLFPGMMPPSDGRNQGIRPNEKEAGGEREEGLLPLPVFHFV